MQRNVLATLALLGTTGCFSSEYVPRDRRKVYHVMQDNRRGYQRDGVFHAEFGFGGGLVEAVAGNPQAEQAAQTFRDRAIGGFVAALTGLVCAPSVLMYDLARSATEDGWHPPATHAALAIGCTVLGFGGLLYFASGIPYQLDAVNIYNDAVDASSMRPMWPPQNQVPAQWPPPSQVPPNQWPPPPNQLPRQDPPSGQGPGAVPPLQR